ncbi:RodZ family helix-turn-helix domain-containing protein [Mastigocladopsis repens]|uniref:hypothetical protein n=1 Tax=Mastigocladopsis repens TaxID=221287 RepID=UPI0002F089A0|nr:hypothetical protein [Mastigocladopsis repens]
MKKQKSRLSLVFLLLFAGCLVSATPLKVYAGQNVVNGTSVESSTFSGDTFNRTNQPAPTQPVPGTNVSVEVNGTISIPQQVQQSLNNVASNIVQQSIDADSTSGTLGTSTSPVVVVLVQGSDASAATSAVQTSLSSLGVSQSLITGLVNNLAGLFKGFDSATTPGVTLAALQPVQLIVDVSQLNGAIEAYNSIVLKSNVETLEKLSNNAEFVEVGLVLKELRAALKAS